MARLALFARVPRRSYDKTSCREGSLLDMKDRSQATHHPLRESVLVQQPLVRCRSSNRTTTPAGSGGHKQNNASHPSCPEFPQNLGGSEWRLACLQPK